MSPPMPPFFDFFFDFFFVSPLAPPIPSAWAIVQEVGSSTASVKNIARINFMVISFVSFVTTRSNWNAPVTIGSMEVDVVWKAR